VDQFADRDLTRLASSAVCPPEQYPDAIPTLAAHFPPGPVLFTGGLENHPHLIHTLAACRELWGNPPEVLARVRDPFGFFPALARSGFATPDLVPQGSACPPNGRWLRKPLRSAGGLGIHGARPGEAPSSLHYFQEFIDGVPMSALYVDGVLFGITEQLIGEPWLHARPFAYCGNIAPGCVAPTLVETLRTLGRALTTHAGLQGVWGIDFVLRHETPLVVEINPRYSAGVEVLELARGVGVFFGRRFGAESGTPTPQPPPCREGVNSGNASWDISNAPLPASGKPTSPPPLPAGRGEKDPRSAVPAGRSEEGLPKFTPSLDRRGLQGEPAGGWEVGSAERTTNRPTIGKAIYYAPHALAFPRSGPWDADLAGAFDPWRVPGFADVPEPGTPIEHGSPVCTFFATGTTPTEVRERLQAKATELDALFRGHRV
jgi:hypothetical protein